MTCIPTTNARNEIWDATGVHFDCDTGLPVTGRWRALTTADLNPATQFGFTIHPFSGGLTQVPVGVKAWSIGVLSGAVFVDNVGPLPLGTSLNGGNYATQARLAAAITISGAVGAAGLVMWEG